MKEKESRYEKSKTIPKINDVYDLLCWGEVATQYFDHSVSWFYNKMRGVDGNGGEGQFTPEETLILKGALIDISARIRRSAENL